MSERVNFMEIIAKEKCAGGDGWKQCGWLRCGKDATIVEGGIPGVIARGPRKGRDKWIGVVIAKCVVTDSEILAAQSAYEAATGNCSQCSGTGKDWAGWHYQTGNKYRDCTACQATGKCK